MQHSPCVSKVMPFALEHINVGLYGMCHLNNCAQLIHHHLHLMPPKSNVLCFCLRQWPKDAPLAMQAFSSMLQVFKSCGIAVTLLIVRQMRKMHFGIATKACNLSATTSKCYQSRTHAHSQGLEKGVGVQGARPSDCAASWQWCW